MTFKIKIPVFSFVVIQLFLLFSCSETESKIQALSIQEKRISFGKELFFDKQLSITGKVSCATCHIPEKYFSDNQEKGVGIHGRKTNRNVPSILNVKNQPYFMFDGGVKTLEMQMLVPIQDTNEMGEQMKHILIKLNKNKSYRKKAKELYNRKLDAFVLTRAIAAYERSLVSSNSRYDQYKKGRIQLTKLEKRGERLFFELKCNRCHSGKDFTDFTFQDNGLSEHSPLDLGRSRITENETDKWKFKVPSLKNCEKTAPYLHDGSMKTLEQVVIAYEYSKNPTTKIRSLSRMERKSLIEFLKSLSEKIENQ